MSQPQSVSKPSPRLARSRFWKRVLLWSGLFLLLCLCLGLGVFLYLRKAADERLEDVIATIDREDPGWRLEDIEASREVIPDDRNAALLVAAAGKLVPEEWDSFECDLALESLE